MGNNGEHTPTEVAGLIGWRRVRNSQDKWIQANISLEFGLHRRTIAQIFDKLSTVVDNEVESAIDVNPDNGGWYYSKRYYLRGEPRCANGKPLSSEAGAFVFASHLAHQWWATNSELAKMAKWTETRTRQLVLYRLRYLPLAKFYRKVNPEVLWVVID